MVHESYLGPERLQEAAEGYLDSLGGSREPFERQLKGLGPLNLCIGRLSGRQLKGLGPPKPLHRASLQSWGLG